MKGRRNTGRNGGRRPHYKHVDYTDEQKVLISKAKERGKEICTPRYPIDVRFTQSGNFTKCVIVGKDRICLGVAKRNPQDPANEKTARDIAFYRAVTEQPVVMQ